MTITLKRKFIFSKQFFIVLFIAIVLASIILGVGLVVSVAIQNVIAEFVYIGLVVLASLGILIMFPLSVFLNDNNSAKE